MSVVAFDYAAWSARYPEFAQTVDANKAAECFADACLYLDNTDCSIVKDVTNRARLLNMLTAHIAQISFGSSTQPISPLVGRVAGATEGSVSVTTAYAAAAGSRAWYDQTKYGAAYWQATVNYRNARYVPGRQPRFFP